jgi:hypothetical protein
MNDQTDEQQIDVRQIEADIWLKLAQIQLTAAEELLTIKKVPLARMRAVRRCRNHDRARAGQNLYGLKGVDRAAQRF